MSIHHFLSFSLFFLSGLSLQAQFPALSPKAEIRQQVGNATITLEYQRPIARGREIFGGLVPYDKPWQTSAGSTTIRFDQPVTIDEQTLPAGIYALITIPGKKEWTIIIHDAEHGTMRYEKSTLRVQTCVPVTQSGRFYEALSLDFDVDQHNARLYISWTDVQVSLLIETATQTESMASIDSLLAGPLLADDLPYMRAANYLSFNQLEPQKTITLIKQMIQIKEREYFYRMLVKAYRQAEQPELALTAIDRGLETMRQEFAGQTETLASITAQYEEQRALILANSEKKKTGF